jgi:hypothetical protein
MKWIDSKDLEMWAERRSCQEYLPLVIRRLIRASVNGIESISFPAGESIIYPGWDGKLESLEETEYVPKGLSVWEIGTNKDIKRKAEDDYKKRKQNPLGVNPSDTVFIFLTPRIWTTKEDWAEEKRNEKFWRDIKVYDARDLEEWLEQKPAVGAWLAKHIGKYPRNALSLEDWWNEWSQVTRPPIIPELALGGRTEESAKVIDWLKEAPKSLSVQALTKDESIAFLFAVIFTLPENEKEYFFSRSLVVLDKDSFRHIVTTNKNGLIIIPTFEEIDIAGSYSNLHHIFIPLSSDSTVRQEKIVLPWIKKEEFISCLERMGITKENAENYSQDTARCLSVLRRQLSPTAKQPEWAKPENVKELLPALLIGKWNEINEDDKEIISDIAGSSYDEYVISLKRWLYQPDPPIIKIGEIWRLLSFLDAFFILSPFLSSNHFGKFKNISLKVLKEIDPALELEPEKRWMASVYGKTPKYSKELREGITQTLTLIAVFGDKVNNGRGLDLPYGYHTSQVFVDHIVKELLNKADWKLWCSLSDVLPLIAEASPSSFLDAVENSLLQNPPPIIGMFSETEDAFTSHSAHPSLLWALEGLAWDPSLLGRVTLILGKLARLDPGGKLANRPINSLRAIFLLWLPQTFADLEQKLKVLDLLIKREPQVAWDLLINLIPHAHDIVFPNHKPRWRQFSEKTENKVTIKEHLEGITGIVDRILKNVNYDGGRWCQVMEHFSDLPPQEREKVFCKLSECINSIDEGKFELWNKLREILCRHRSFHDAEWLLPEKELLEIEKLYNKLEPKDNIKRFQWLFDDYWPELPEGKEIKDYEKLEEIISTKRKNAIQSIKNDLGINGLIGLATQTKNPQFVGFTLAEFSLPDEEEKILFSLLDSDNQKKVLFVQAYLWHKSSKIGDTYIEKVVSKAKSENWSSERVVNLFLALPQRKSVWELLKNFDEQIQKEYWRRLHPKFFDLPSEDKLYALNQLIAVKKYFTALYTAAMFKEEIPAKVIAELLRKAALEKSIDNINIIHSWDIEELFKILDEAKEINSNEIALLEWLYLPILANVGSSRPPKMLHQELSNNPEFFAEVIKYLYKPRNKDVEEEEELLREVKEQRAHFAWKLLHTWKTIPGSDDSGKVDYQKLKNWIDKTRELCKKIDRIEVCDNHIGQVFAHALPDENGCWPPEGICKIVEEVGSKELDNGFIIGIYNKRGTVTKSLFEGGEQERKLAKQYMEYSQKLAIQYPRTSAILKKVAEGYENQAKQEDKEAEKRDLEW